LEVVDREDRESEAIRKNGGGEEEAVKNSL